ncbi:MAG: prephenate dehydrogenase/arogenate dehydrogenase family protein [Bacteroidota bacterium]|nr:prephenate dehydrogenase/arogenate dehydrogenase family protein [Candidatus Kapabacteria bacterium]MDW8220406.1 prephenate dehydrogenase/arogenate dehydrogenase family protein [Bacteroidota bacterium]
MNIHSVGIIGYGRFGRLLAHSLCEDFKIRVFEPYQACEDTKSHISFCSLQDTVRADCVFLCVPITVFSLVVQEIATCVPQGTPVADVCSVKLYPSSVMRKHLRPRVPILPTHPMFGPVSAQNGWADLPFVFCPENDATKQEIAVLEFWKQYVAKRHRARPVVMSADEHDRITAYNLCLTQLLGRVLGNLGLQPSPIDAQSFKHLLFMKDMSYSDSLELLIGMHRFNPYAQEMRRRLRDELESIEQILVTGEAVEKCWDESDR